MRAADREKLARMQADLVRALAGRGPVPPGFDAGGVAVTEIMLRAKRRHSVARAWPGLVRALGESFEEKFAAFTKTNSIPPEGGALADGRAFARVLAHLGELPDEGRLEALWVDLRYKKQGPRLAPRRGVAVKAALFKTPLRLVIILRRPRARRDKSREAAFVERRFTLQLTSR